MSLGILIDEHLGQFDWVRNKPSKFADRLRAAAAKQIFGAQPLVRGHDVAAGDLVEALVRHGNLQRYHLFAYPGNHAAVCKRFGALARYAAGSKTLAVNSVGEIPCGGADRYQIAAWLNPIPFCRVNGGIEVSHRIRRYYSSTIFPITTVMHALSGRPDSYYVFLRLLLEGALPCDSLICTSRASSASFQRMLDGLVEQFRAAFGTELRYNGRLDLIPLCVDTSTLRPQDKGKLRRELSLPKNVFVILTLGRLSAVNKMDLFPFLRVLGCLVKRYRGKRQLLWVVAGTEDEGYTAALNHRARELGVRKNLKVTLNPSDDVKTQLLAASDLFMLPVDTVGESFGLAPVEAMACGIPQVVSDWDGFRDTVVHGQTGFLIPTYWARCHGDLAESSAIAGTSFDYLRLGQSTGIDLNKATEYLQFLIENEDLRAEMARRSRERAISLYSGEAVTSQYEQLWSELAGIARGLPLLSRAASFDQLIYDNVFSHYASNVLSDDTVLCATSLVRAGPGEGISSDLAISRLGAAVPETRILADALAELAANGECGVRFGDLVEFLGGCSGRDRDRIRRGILWLVKYGYARPTLTA